MCLFAYNTRPLVSNRDLTVVKMLQRCDNGEYLTPYMNTPVKLGETMTAKGNVEYLPEDYSANIIEEGAIHAYIHNPDPTNYRLVKAVIKAGTQFYVNTDLTQIAAKKLLVTRTEINAKNKNQIYNEVGETRNQIISFIKESMRNRNGITVGDFLLADKTFVKPQNLTKEMDVIGVVSFIRKDGHPHIIALSDKETGWRSWSMDKKLIDFNSHIEAANDFKGRKNTKRLYEIYRKYLADTPTLRYCLDYQTEGTKKGDWFLMSAGECLQTMRNKYIINKSLMRYAKLHQGMVPVCLLGDSTEYWTSTPRSAWFVWMVDSEKAGLCQHDHISARVRPSFKYSPHARILGWPRKFIYRIKRLLRR